MRIYLVVGLLAICLASCDFSKKKAAIAQRDTTITKENSFTELFLDSSHVVNFARHSLTQDSLSDKMVSFYNQRNYQMAWFFPDGVSDFVATFLSLQADYIHYSGDSSLSNPLLNKQIDSLQTLNNINPNDSLVILAELALTSQFFKYTSKAYFGNKQLNIQELNWYIPRKKIDYISFLDSALINNGKDISKFEPVNEQYNLLKNNLLGFYQYAKDSMTTLSIQKTILFGDSTPVLSEIKQRLKMYGEIQIQDTSVYFDSTTLRAVISFQKRMGLKTDGEIGPAFMREINVPVKERITQILINIERIRWLPKSINSDYILVNIPEYKLHYFEKGSKVFDMAVVVGSQAHNTVVFSGTINQIVFSPYWNIPTSILRNEIIPGIRKNSNYLASHNMEWVGNRVRQKPGRRNSLGLVKFLFPNSFSIYFHDTPSKSLFGQTQRAFSHGCIRLSQPQKLAEYLLRKNSTWTKEKIVGAMNSGKEKYVRLPKAQEVPVFIIYLTSWVGVDGALNFRKDIYGHDKKMKDRLFQN